ncbi:MAG: hypothetical protein WA154_03445, partial [Moraxellaceae bacterium]
PRVRDPQQEFIDSMQRDIAIKDARIAELEALCFKKESEKEPFSEKEPAHVEIKKEKRHASNKIVKIAESTDRLAAESERLARLERERLARLETAVRNLVGTEQLAKEEALAKLEAEEADRLAKLEAEQLAKLESEQLAKLESEQLAKLETDRLAKLETDRLAKLETDRLANEEAERLANEEAEAEDDVDDSSRPEEVEEEGFEEMTIQGKNYFVSDSQIVYTIVGDGCDEVGDEVGTLVLVNGKFVVAKK